MREVTEVKITEHGDETHESWLLVRANHVSSTPGTRLFDSEIDHQHFIVVNISRCTRKRRLSGDWLHATEVLMEINMSQSQWGAFVSSFGQGGGVPATLDHLIGEGQIPRAPTESRLDESHKEVLAAGDKALGEIRESYEDLLAAFEMGEGKRQMLAAIRDLGIKINHGPANMEFAAKRLTEHTENVVTKARADIEGMVLDAQRGLGDGSPPLAIEQTNEEER